jgi:penicillin-binding protein 1A
MVAARDAEIETETAGEPDAPPQPPLSRVRMVKRAVKIAALLFALVVIWLTVTAPLSRSLQPVGAPGLTILSADGETIARRGAVIGEPVSVEDLPAHVGQAFLAIEDRRFYSHLGIDPWGIARAMVRNLMAGRVREGGSTISQQLAKTSFLSPERTVTRKLQEALITVWLEVWLSKEEILSRYLSNVYFGDNVYGLRAAAHHYFSAEPEELTVPQAAMLAGIVNAPSRLAPTNNLEGAQERGELVMREMVEAGFLTEQENEELRPARLDLGESDDVPTGTYFADWVIPQATELAEGSYGERQVVTTLEGDLQRLAVRTVRRAGLGRAQVALVAMRLDGRVVAMVGGKDYRRSAFNRATQARRQPGSAFKPFVYLAAFRAGYTPTTPVNDVPIRLGSWEPRNYGGDYRGRITLREAVAFSSNSVAVQIQERVGRDNVIRAARDLGISTPLRPDPSLALGASGVSLIELTAAYAAIAAGRYPIRPRGLPQQGGGWFGGGPSADDLSRDRAFPMLRDVLYAVANLGTGRAAALSIPTFGKTGTTSDYRDAWFVGFAGDLVVGVWIGNDDNSPLPGTTGGGLPARIWRDFMADALGIRPVQRPARVPLSQADRAPEPQPEPSNAQAPAPTSDAANLPADDGPAPGQAPAPETATTPPPTLPKEQLPPPPPRGE